MNRKIEIGDWVRAETDNGVVESTVCFVVEQDGMIVLANTHVQADDIIEVRKIHGEEKRPVYDDIEGVTETEVELYKERMREFEIGFGRGSVADRVRIAISALDTVWTIDDLKELSGASRDTTERVVRKEQIRGVVDVVGEARTGGRPKSIYLTS